MKEKPEHILFLKWLILTGIIVFAVVVAWDQNIIALLFHVDKSRICWAIALVYLLVTLHCARLVFNMSAQSNFTQQVNKTIRQQSDLEFALDNDKVRINKSITLPDCFMTDYIHDLYLRSHHRNSNENNGSTSGLAEVYESRLKGPQEIGWFASDIMLKMGLLGTIIGFILMLGSVANITDFDITTMQKILKHMSEGMATALYTTLAGLIGSILSAMQYHILDRHADELMETSRHLTQVYVIPKFS